ncbi:hypothetical protein N7474_008013 [Penicillium riverlandense]|uniref:uncharacterized protein n=1 Tax=Penicillium riverlandense TaxID=1903569 RepID=UPI0025482061|nr:uncharacterized protein N7474_008013 [Penicillium riverlandense]KAJ5811712.1 hypothetical protein N7474_008013 [Penicillium riverlandense]
MPLVVPGINSAPDAKSDWANKLMGKKLSDSTSDVNTFAKKDLPESHRVLKPGDMKTMDHQPTRYVLPFGTETMSNNYRLNIHVDEDGNVHDVNYG